MKVGGAVEYKTIDIDQVWAGHPVHFACEKNGDIVFVSYYNADRELIVASYNLLTNDLQKCKLPETLGWDSHNGVSLGIDSAGFIHVSANMHGSPLVYYKSKLPLSVDGFEQLNVMVGNDEGSCTYPVFVIHNDTLYFRYRNGRSGKGDTYINEYDSNHASWKRVLSTPLFDGESQRNAYPGEFVLGKDGFFHLVWVWRETPDCETTHTPSYAKTRDFVTWYTASGKPIHLPIRNGGGDVIESIPVKSGLLNNCLKVGFDSAGRQVVSYFHFDNEGNTQLFNAQFVESKWYVCQTSRWSYRWDFSGRGAITSEIEVFPVRFESNEMTQRWKHKEYGEGMWVLDESFNIRENRELPDIYKELSRKSNDAYINKICGSVDSGLFMAWETLPANRDKEREVFDNTLISSQLRLYVDLSKIK